MYRKGVSAFLFNDKKEFVLVQSTGEPDYYKIPAGGVEDNESDELALKREMKEELDVDIEILEKSTIIEKFDWPKYAIEHKYKQVGIRYEGQIRSIFIAKIKSNIDDIKLQEEEVSGFVFVNKDNFVKYLKFPRQKEIMDKIISEFKDFF
jgi:8-oxo-dGTP pyrophosphatase MutT (NUDIX family)